MMVDETEFDIMDADHESRLNDPDYCECQNEYTINELEFECCACCGKNIDPIDIGG